MAADNIVRTSWDWLPDASADDGVADCDEHQRVFEFVQSLAAELSRGRIDLPTCPNVAQGMQQALDEEDLSNTRITRLIGADPGLAANVLALANGKAQSRGTKPFTDLKLAVTRIGPDHVRSAALPYVMQKIRTARAHDHLSGDLARLWERSTHVAAIARILAVRTGAAAPDVALLAGLLHNIGSIYLLSRADQHLTIFRNPATRDVLMHDWQAPIGKAIAQNWGLADAIADAIGDQDQLDRHEVGARDLTDVLCIAVRLTSYVGHPEALEIAMHSMPLFKRLRLDAGELRAVLHEAAAQTAGLRTALAIDG